MIPLYLVQGLQNHPVNSGNLQTKQMRTAKVFWSHGVGKATLGRYGETPVLYCGRSANGERREKVKRRES